MIVKMKVRLHEDLRIFQSEKVQSYISSYLWVFDFQKYDSIDYITLNIYVRSLKLVIPAVHQVKGREQCFSMQVLLNNCCPKFVLNSKKIGTDLYCYFREKRKNYAL